MTTSTGPQSSGISRALLAVGAVGLVPWLSYALHMWALWDERSDSDITLGIDHYSVQGALALSLAVLPLLAAWRQDARPFIPVWAGTAAFYLGPSRSPHKLSRWSRSGRVGCRDGLGDRPSRHLRFLDTAPSAKGHFRRTSHP